MLCITPENVTPRRVGGDGCERPNSELARLRLTTSLEITILYIALQRVIRRQGARSVNRKACRKWLKYNRLCRNGNNAAEKLPIQNGTAFYGEWNALS